VVGALPQALEQLRAGGQGPELADVRTWAATGLQLMDLRGTQPHHGTAPDGEDDNTFLAATVIKTVEAVGRLQSAGARCMPVS